MKRLLLALGAVALLAPPASSQNAITQEGSVLQNSPMMFRGNNRARQGAPVGGAPTGQIVTTGDAVAGGRCDYSGPTDSPYYFLCIDAATGRIRMGGTKQPPIALSVEMNGQIYPFPTTSINAQWWVDDNAQLKIRAIKEGPVYRSGFYAPGDGGGAIYTWTATPCTLNGGNGNDGSQVRSDSGGCWNMAAQGSVNLRLFGAQANISSFDSGPAIRAASLYSELSGSTISVPAGTFYLNTLDPEGTGAIVLGKTDRNVPSPGYPLPTFKTMPNFVGQVWHTVPDMCFVTEPAFILGPGLNRPLVYVKPNSVSVRIENMCLSGNRPAQSAHPGGPGGKLYTVELADATSPHPASSFTGKNVAIRDGYNGNLYQGGYRSLLYLTDVWSLYSGQDGSDIQMLLVAYDSIIYNLQQGFSKGIGVLVSGINYTFTSGGFFWNDGTGLHVSNSTVDMQVTGMRFNDNKCHGMVIDNALPIGENRVGGRVYTGLIFNDNSQSGNGLCDDISVVGGPGAQGTVFRDSFSGTVFDGKIKTTATILPRYNVNTGENVRLIMNGTVAGTSPISVNGFAADYKAIVGDLQVSPSWVPHLYGTVSGGSGVETSPPGFPAGQWQRNGKVATVQGTVKLTAFSATGDLVVGEFPHEARTDAYAACQVSRVVGWNPPAGYTTLSMLYGPGTLFAGLWKNGPGVPTDEVAPSEFATPFEFTFMCIYPIKDGT